MAGHGCFIPFMEGMPKIIWTALTLKSQMPFTPREPVCYFIAGMRIRLSRGALNNSL